VPAAAVRLVASAGLVNRMLDTDSDTDNDEVGVDRLVPDSVSLASTVATIQAGEDYDEFWRPTYILSPVTTVVDIVLDDVDDDFRIPSDPVSPATTAMFVEPDPLPCIRCGSGSVVVNDLTYNDNRRKNHRHNARLRLQYLLYHELAHENFRKHPWLDLVPLMIGYLMCEPLRIP